MGNLALFYKKLIRPYGGQICFGKTGNTTAYAKRDVTVAIFSFHRLDLNAITIDYCLFVAHTSGNAVQEEG